MTREEKFPRPFRGSEEDGRDYQYSLSNRDEWWGSAEGPAPASPPAPSITTDSKVTCGCLLPRQLWQSPTTAKVGAL